MTYRIALDAMGGDYAPREIVRGAVQAARKLDVEMILVGRREAIEAELAQVSAEDSGCLPPLKIVHAHQVIAFDEAPSLVAKERRGASIRVICDLVRDGQADACLTMGHSGAAVIASVMAFGKIEGVERPAFGVPYFNLQPKTFFLDVGAIVDCKPEYLAQFARMGSIYVEKVLGIPNPTVALMTNGREDNKGNELTRAAFELLKQSGLNFIGNVEGYDLPNGTANVIVTDGLWGNIMLKLSEGLSEQLLNRMTQRFAEVGLAGQTRGVVREFEEMMDYARIGALPVLGVNGLCLIGHGRSTASAVVGAIETAVQALEVDLIAALKKGLREVQV